jgi:ABC-type multidrug transport system ATPase subunit
MGICPQFDILWNELTAKEHLKLFATLKGVPPRQIEQEADRLLEEVKLADVGHVTAGVC